MPADPIREALEVAAKASHQTYGAGFTWPSWEDDVEARRAYFRADAAVNIIAFLQSYVPHHAAQDGLGPDLAEIAAAVEKAAKG